MENGDFVIYDANGNKYVVRQSSVPILLMQNLFNYNGPYRELLRAIKRPRTVGKPPRCDVMAGRQHLRAEFTRRLQQIAELDRAVAVDARHRRLAGGVAVGKAVDHALRLNRLS